MTPFRPQLRRRRCFRRRHREGSTPRRVASLHRFGNKTLDTAQCVETITSPREHSTNQILIWYVALGDVQLASCYLRPQLSRLWMETPLMLFCCSIEEGSAAVSKAAPQETVRGTKTNISVHRRRRTTELVIKEPATQLIDVMAPLSA